MDFIKLETEILKFWKDKKIFDKLRAKNKGKKRWSFLDGPITANNPMGVHHAWGRAYKDFFQRHKAMQGYDQRYQNGFDCQGLWVEVGVEKDLGLNSKKEIEEYGLAKFSKKCRERVEKYSKIITEQSIRLGQWMDWENSYYTMSDNNIAGIWYFLKKCQAKKWLFRGQRVMPWCTRCGTSLSQHELIDSYKEVTHQAVYLKLPIKGKKNEYFLVWTTTPWTLSSNTALAVNPKLTYLKVQVGEEIYYLSKETTEIFGDDYKVLEKVSGKIFINWEYAGPYDELPAQKDVKHRVINWSEVGEEEGTGIVHIAPGCGAEDLELSKENNLAIIAPLDEHGVYLKDFGWLTNKNVSQVQDDIFKDLKKKGYLFKIAEYKHRYPYCWRCDQELVFRLVNEWFIEAKKIREQMKQEVKKIEWIPEYGGKLMHDWLDNMGDWCISRKRYWGLPLPFYQCKCGELIVVGSKEELKKLAVEPVKVDELPELHRPWIDEIKIKCPKCGKSITRVTEVGDCWLDAGITSFSTLNYLTDKKYWQKWFPFELICEMREQVRLWFYSLLFMSITLENKTPYKKVFLHEKVNDEKGQPMHKSLGNAIWLDEAVAKIGADALRWIYLGANQRNNLNFSFSLGDEIRRKFLVFWNVLSFYQMYAPKKNSLEKLPILNNVLDKWVISKLNLLIKEVNDKLAKYDIAGSIHLLEKFIIDDLSTWYLRRSRQRFKSNNLTDKKTAINVLGYCLLSLTKLLAPFVPFLTEKIYQELGGKLESIHLTDWLIADKKKIDKKIMTQMELVRQEAEKGLSLRSEHNIKIRQPLASYASPEIKKILPKFQKILKEELNVLELKTGAKEKLDTKLTPALQEQGLLRELIRSINALRKKQGLTIQDKIVLIYQTESLDLQKVFNKFSDEIKQATISKEVKIGKGENELKINQEEVKVSLKKD